MTHHLYLYNDNEHSFKYVYTAIIEILGHLPLQAEQCCLIADQNGKCQVKESDDILEIQKFKQKFEEFNLKVEILDKNYA